jgi:AraC-like DNA-binding protein
MEYRRFILPDGIAQPGPWKTYTLRSRRLLILLDGEKDEYVSLRGELQLVPMRRGDMLFFRRNIWEYADFKRPQRLLGIIEQEDYLRLVLYHTHGPHYQVPVGEEPATYHTSQDPLPVFHHVFSALEAPDAIGTSHLFHLVRAALELAIQECQRDDQGTPRSHAFQNYLELCRHLENNYMFPLTRESISRALRLTPSYISALFRKWGQTNLWSYLLDLRLGAARNLLLEARLSIKEIAEKCGFASDIYFIRCFHRKYHLTPGECRKH